MMHRLLIDIGNTSAKLAVSRAGEIVHHERLAQPWLQAFRRLSAQFPIQRCVISTVAAPDAQLAEALSQMQFPQVVWLTADTPCCIHDVPMGYGADRLAADIGARMQCPQPSPLLVIDAGTCITYDFIDAQSRIVSGVISPGVQLRLTAMHEHTALLPQLQAEPDAPLLGTDTRTCMMSSAIHGVRFEIEGYVRTLLAAHPQLHVFVTGGNQFSYSPDIRSRITHDPMLVLRGLMSL